MGWKYHTGIDAFTASRRHKAHKTFNLAIFNLLEALKPQQMVCTKRLRIRDEFLFFIILVN
jgi:hypothetical protein